MYPAPVFTDEARASLEKRLTATEWAQPAILATSLATLRLLERLGLSPTVVGGHSLGEITAGVAAGVFDESAGLAVARRRGELMAKASETAGAMTAAASDPATVARVVEGIDVVLANHNAPRQVVLSGAVDAIERAERALEAAQITARRLPVATAFHSPLVEPSVAPFAAFLDGVPGAVPRVPYYANATAAPYGGERAEVCTELAAAIARPVRFVEQVDAMYTAGIRTFVEVGPDSVLTRLVERCLEGRPHVAIATDQRGKHGVTTLLQALGRLSTAGVPVKFAGLWEREALPEDLAAKPAAKFSIKLSGANHGKPYPPPEGAPRPAPALKVAPTAASAPSPSQPSPSPSRDARPAAPTMRAAAVHPPVIAPPPVVAPPAPSRTAMQKPPVSAPLAPSVAPSPTSVGASDWVESLQRLQAPAIAAQLEFQRMMAESHMAFLRAVETSYATVVPAATSFVQVAPMAAAVVAPSMQVAPIPVAAAPAAQAPVVATPVVPTPVVAPPVAPARVPAPPASRDLTPVLLTIVSEKTGYPEEMIDMSMDMEADLGIDSIKRVEILSAMKAAVPDLPQVATAKMAATRTLAQIIELMGGALSGGAAAGAPVAASSVPAAMAVTESSPSRVLELQPVLLSIVSDKTGYPVEMIDTSMDMEADLGIDSIKRVEILSAMKQAVPDLPQVATSKMAATRTLAQIIELMGGALPSAVASVESAAHPAPAAPSPAAASRVTELQPVLLSIVSDKTGYPVEMIDTSMDMEADLGIDSIKRVEILSAMRQAVPDLPQVATSKMAATRTLAQIIELMGGAAHAGCPGRGGAAPRRGLRPRRARGRSGLEGRRIAAGVAVDRR